MRREIVAKGSPKTQKDSNSGVNQLPPDLYKSEKCSAEKVSLAWVVRDAAEKHVADLLAASRTIIVLTRLVL